MQNFFALLFLFLLCGGCDSPEPQPGKPIELTFQMLSADELELFYQDCGIHDTLRSWITEESFLRMSVKNNTYELLCLHLAKFGKNLVYRSDVIYRYQVEGDSLRGMYKDIRCFMQTDSIVCLKKGQFATVYFEGRCADKNASYEYNFSFFADSAGQGKNPQFMQFPCGVGLPKKKIF